MSLQPIPSAARPSINVRGISRNMSMGQVAAMRASRMGIMWITWWKVIFIIPIMDTVMTMGLLKLPEPLHHVQPHTGMGRLRVTAGSILPPLTLAR